jgi:hypothetical protein
MRFGLARRLLGAATGHDLLAPDLARSLDYRPKAAYRWESGEDRPRPDTVERFAAMCRRAGLPITAGWLERGETQLGAIVIPPEALVPKPLPKPKPPHREAPLRRKRIPAPKSGDATSARKSRGA